jgi:serine/threonine-protein phosphatase with EF-hand domain
MELRSGSDCLFQVFDVLWSDPQPGDGCIPNTLRGAGTYFGPDVTEKFLQKYKLLYLIRSHECKPEGYEITHSSKVSKHNTHYSSL